MTSMTYIAFPAERVDAARDEIAMLWARLERAALRAGQPAPEAPVLTESNRRVVGECGACRMRYPESSVRATCNRETATSAWCGGFIRGREVVDLELQAPAARLAGWEFLAVVEPLEGGNLIRQVPGADTAGVDFAAWRAGAVVCDHCATKRRRNETFLVRASAELATACDATVSMLPTTTARLAIERTIKQVGRQCLADFLGGLSPATIIAQLSLDSIIRTAGGGDEVGGWSGCRAPEGHDPLEFLTWAASVIRHDGWVSKGAAEAQQRQSTAGMTDYLLTPQFGDQAVTKHREARTKYAPTDADADLASRALAWAQSWDELSDYAQNVRLVARQPIALGKHLGILASALSAYERAMGREIERARRAVSAAASEHIGEVGERIEVAIIVERVADVDTQYGTMHIHTLRAHDGTGAALLWRTNAKRLEVGARMIVKGTIKAHSEFRGEKQTELTRCKVVQELDAVQVAS